MDPLPEICKTKYSLSGDINVHKFKDKFSEYISSTYATKCGKFISKNEKKRKLQMTSL